MSFTLGSTNTNQQPTTGFGTFGQGSTSLTTNKPTFATPTGSLFGNTSGLGTNTSTSGNLFGNTTSLGNQPTGFGTTNLSASQPSTSFGTATNTFNTGSTTGFNLGGNLGKQN